MKRAYTSLTYLYNYIGNTTVDVLQKECLPCSKRRSHNLTETTRQDKLVRANKLAITFNTNSPRSVRFARVIDSGASEPTPITSSVGIRKRRAAPKSKGFVNFSSVINTQSNGIVINPACNAACTNGIGGLKTRNDTILRITNRGSIAPMIFNANAAT